MKNALLLLIFIPSLLMGQATVTEELRSLKTYPFSDPNPIPILAKNPKIYPYHTFDGYSKTAINKDWKVVTLENEFIKVFVLPEIGGKIWGAIDKVNGEEFIYRNEVIKFRNISMRGPWTSGGIEFNFGIIGHHPSTATPVDYVTEEHDDGSVSCTVGNIDLPSRTQWRVTIKLQKDKSYFETNVNWYNPSTLHQSYYNWMTAAAFAQDDLVFHTPGDEYLKHSGEAMSWPIDKEGRDISAYKQNNFEGSKSYHVVGEYNDFFGGYFEQEDYGFGHWSEYEEIPGQKLWIWALSRSGGIWEDLLTDTDGQYIEFQAGREFLQYSPGSHNNPMTQAVFAPHSQDTWSEIWFPVRDIGGISDVSPMGVMHITQDEGILRLGLNVFQSAKGTIVFKQGDKVIANDQYDLENTNSLFKEYPLNPNADFSITIDELDLYYESNQEGKEIKRPFDSGVLLSAEGQEKNYYLGWEAYKYREYVKAEKLLKACLVANHLHQAARATLAELYYRHDKVQLALAHLDTLLRINTRSPHGNYIAGLCYRSLQDDTNALESFGWAARSIEFRSAAYTEMAEIYLKQNRFRQAQKYADKALIFNSQNIAALQVNVIANRLSDQKTKASNYIEKILKLDQLNHFARFETYLLDKDDKEKASIAINAHNSELGYQTMVELAISYVNLGREKEARDLLDMSNHDHPLILIWKAYLNPSHSAKYLNLLDESSSQFVFPYRSETNNILESLVNQNAGWKLKYYNALNLWALNHMDEAKTIFQSLGTEPNEASFYLARKEILKEIENYNALNDLNKALELDRSRIVYHQNALQAFEEKKYRLAKSLATEGIQNYPNDYVLMVDAAKAMLHLGEFDEAAAILDAIEVLPFEGASEGKRIYSLIHNAIALEQAQHGSYTEAISSLNKSKLWPESLGVGKPFNPNEVFQNYLLAKIYQKIGDHKNSKQYGDTVLDYHQALDNIHDPKIALTLDVMKNRKNHGDRINQIIKSIQDQNIKDLISKKPIPIDRQTFVLQQLSQALDF